MRIVIISGIAYTSYKYMGDVLILFRNSKKLKAFDKQLLENKIIFKKENIALIEHVK